MGIYLFSSVYLKFLGSKSTLICSLYIIAKNFNTFLCKGLPNLQQASILGESCADPCPKLWIWGMDKCLEISQNRHSPTLFKWTQSDKLLPKLFTAVISLPWILLSSFPRWFWKCDFFGRCHKWSRFVTHFILHRMSQCIEKVGDRHYALWAYQLYLK